MLGVGTYMPVSSSANACGISGDPHDSLLLAPYNEELESLWLDLFQLFLRVNEFVRCNRDIVVVGCSVVIVV